MKTVNIHEAKTNLSSLLHDIEKGETIIICKNGKPVADLIPHRKGSRLKRHPHLSKIRINYNPIEPLEEDEWQSSE